MQQPWCDFNEKCVMCSKWDDVKENLEAVEVDRSKWLTSKGAAWAGGLLVIAQAAPYVNELPKNLKKNLDKQVKIDQEIEGSLDKLFPWESATYCAGVRYRSIRKEAKGFGAGAKNFYQKPFKGVKLKFARDAYVDMRSALVLLGGPIPNSYVRNINAWLNDQSEARYVFGIHCGTTNDDHRAAEKLRKLEPYQREGSSDGVPKHRTMLLEKCKGDPMRVASVMGSDAYPRFNSAKVVVDYFMISVLPNLKSLMDDESFPPPCLLLSGCSYAGTMAALHALASTNTAKWLREELSVAGAEYFQVLGRVNVGSEYEPNVKSLDIDKNTLTLYRLKGKHLEFKPRKALNVT